MEPVESGIKSAMPNGYNYLIEIPTETFGKLQASTSNGVIQKELVTDLGRKHLLYGNTSSRRVGPVRCYSDAKAAALGKSPYKFGHVDRPLKKGLYDKNPIYEDIGFGNQTVIKGQRLNDVLEHTTYNVYENTPYGIQKTIHFGDQIFLPQPSQLNGSPLSRKELFDPFDLGF